MKNILLIFIIFIILSASILYVFFQKKKGVKCIGCPYAEECKHKNCNHQK